MSVSTIVEAPEDYPAPELSLVAESIDHLAQGISVFDGDLRLALFNRRFVELLGFPSELAQVGTPLDAFFRYNAKRGEYGDGDVETLVAERMDLARKRQPHSFERTRPDGIVIEIVGRPLPDGGFVTTYADITERRVAEEKLKQSADFLRLVLDSNPGYIFWKDRNFVYQGCNKNFADAAGAESPEDVVGMTDEQMPWAKDVLADIRGRDNKIIETGTAIVGTLQQLPLADGRTIMAQVSKVPLKDPKGNVVGLLGVFEDVSERQRAEEELLEAKAAAESADRAKTAFLNKMSHELRTPLNAIIGFSQIWMDEVFGEVANEKYMGYAKDINEASTHLMGIISDILEFSVAENQRTELNEVDINLADAIDGAIMLVRQRAEEGGVKLNRPIPAETLRLKADERRFKQIVINLLANAIKFTPVGGEVHISTELEEAGTTALRISDTGVGIDQADMETIFEPFGQAEMTYVRDHDGVGLGLPIVRSLVDEHGGTIDLMSTPGRGTTVTVRFPAHRAITP